MSIDPQDEALATLTGYSDMLIRGLVMAADVSEAVTSVNIVRTINGAPTLELHVDDSGRKLLNSGIIAHMASVQLAPFTYEMVSVAKSGFEITITCEDQAVAALRRHQKPLSVAPGVMTHVEFARRLVEEIRWLKFITDPTVIVQKSKTSLMRGDPSQHQRQGSWDALQSIASARGWRCFIRGVDEVWYVPDGFLQRMPSKFTISEDHDAVDEIDFDFDAGKKVATANITVRAGRWSLPPGSAVTLEDMGPANGDWILQDLSKEATAKTTTGTLIRPQPILPEPTDDSASAGGSSAVDGSSQIKAVAPPITTSRLAIDFVDEALSQRGKAYKDSAVDLTRNKNPQSFSAPGLVQWAASRVGVNIPGFETLIYNLCRRHGTLISVRQAIHTRGALLFILRGDNQEVAISLGNQTTIEALGSGYGVVESVVAGRDWTVGALVPGMIY